jgi:hypothetical protein
MVFRQQNTVKHPVGGIAARSRSRKSADPLQTVILDRRPEALFSA